MSAVSVIHSYTQRGENLISLAARYDNISEGGAFSP
jgi:hypothetical protein